MPARVAGLPVFPALRQPGRGWSRRDRPLRGRPVSAPTCRLSLPGIAR